VQYPELLPLCSLDALCIATLSAASMAHFDSGGLLDTSLDLGPLRELLGHGLVRVRAVAAAVSAHVPALHRAYCRERLVQAGMEMWHCVCLYKHTHNSVAGSAAGCWTPAWTWHPCVSCWGTDW
jgi:hypothetical protein